MSNVQFTSISNGEERMVEMRYRALLVAGILTAVSSEGFAAVTADSSTWEGQYQGTVLPTADGFTDANPGGATTSVSGGFFHFDTTITQASDFYYINSPSTFNFATGASLEFTLDVNDITGAGGLDFVFPQGTGPTDVIAFEPGDVFIGSVGTYSFDFSGLHTYRLTVLGHTSNLYIDNNPTPVITGGLTGGSNGIGNIYWADVSGGNFSNFDLESMSWTAAGAFVPAVPEPATLGITAMGLLALMRRRSRPKAQ